MNPKTIETKLLTDLGFSFTHSQRAEILIGDAFAEYKSSLIASLDGWAGGKMKQTKKRKRLSSGQPLEDMAVIRMLQDLRNHLKTL